MGRFAAARVKFSSNGREYAVNCNSPAQAGDRVIVRMSDSRELHMVEVTELITCRSACKHSIVCLASEADDYGRGPDGIETQEGLVDWLLRNGWQRLEVDEQPSNEPFNDKWTCVFILLPWHNEIRATIRPLEGRCICLGSNGSNMAGRFHSKTLQTTNYKVSLRWEFVGSFEPDSGNIYRQAAEYAEGDLAVDLEERDERSRFFSEVSPHLVRDTR